MASIRDYAVTEQATATASLVCEMPVHQLMLERFREGE